MAALHVGSERLLAGFDALSGTLLEAFKLIWMITPQTSVWKEDFGALSGVPHARRPEGSADFIKILHGNYDPRRS